MSTENYHSVAALDARIDALSEKLHTLDGRIEQQGRKSLRERFSAAAGVVALAISLATGGFTLYDRVVAEPEREDRAESEAVRKRLDELSQTSLTIQQALLTEPVGGQATLGMLAPKRFSLIQRAERDFAERPYDFLVTDLFLLGNELIAVGRPDGARAFAEAALVRAIDPMEQVNAKVLMARVLGAPSPIRDVGRARALQSAALDQTRATVSPISFGMQMSVLNEMLALELFERNCRAAQDVVDATARQLRAADPGQPYRDQVRSAFELTNRNYGNPCALELSAL